MSISIRSISFSIDIFLQECFIALAVGGSLRAIGTVQIRQLAGVQADDWPRKSFLRRQGGAGLAELSGTAARTTRPEHPRRPSACSARHPAGGVRLQAICCTQHWAGRPRCACSLTRAASSPGALSGDACRKAERQKNSRPPFFRKKDPYSQYNSPKSKQQGLTHLGASPLS